jgi:hypothetical protein
MITAEQYDRRTKTMLSLGVAALGIPALWAISSASDFSFDTIKSEPSPSVSSNSENLDYFSFLDGFKTNLDELLDKTKSMKSSLGTEGSKKDEAKATTSPSEIKPATNTSANNSNWYTIDKDSRTFITSACLNSSELRDEILKNFGTTRGVKIRYTDGSYRCAVNRPVGDNNNLVAKLTIDNNVGNNTSNTTKGVINPEDNTISTIKKEYTTDLLRQLRNQGYLDAFIQTYKANGQDVSEKLAIGLAESSDNENKKANPRNVSLGGYSGFGQVGEGNVAAYCNISDKGLVSLVEKAAIDYKNDKNLSKSERLSMSGRIDPVEWNQCYSDFWKKTIDGKYASFKVSVGVHHSGRKSSLFSRSEECIIKGGNLLEIDCPADGHPNFQGLWARTIAHLENMPYALKQLGYDSNGNKLPIKLASQ